MNPLVTGGLVVIGVGLLAWLLRSASRTEGIDRGALSGAAPADPRGATSAAEPEVDLDVEDEAEDEARQVAAITSDGLMFMPVSDGVEMLAVGSPGEIEEQLAQRAARGRVAGMLTLGDLLGARVVKGTVNVDPWRLEAIGRDREYLAWSFETEEAARVALDMLEDAVVKTPPNADGDPAPPLAAEYEEAKRVKEQTAQELAMMPETEEPEEPR